MRERVLQALGAVTLAVTVVLVIWQGSFTLGDWAPTSIEQTYLFWAVSTLIFLLMVTLGFMLFRTGVRLYIEHRMGRGETGLKTKMVVGALALTFIPVFFMVLFSIQVLNRNLEKWFSRPAENVQLELRELSQALRNQAREKAEAQAAWLATLPQTRRYLETGVRDGKFFDSLCSGRRIFAAYLIAGAGQRLAICEPPAGGEGRRTVEARERLDAPGGESAELVLSSKLNIDLAKKQREIDRYINEYEQLRLSRKATRSTYLLLLALITLFILFVATWIALFLAKQINVPISALLAAAAQVRKGNLSYRVNVQAIDELGGLVRAFNEMTEGLQANRHELELRRRFIEAIVDNIPSGVVSISSEGLIRTSNRALAHIFLEQKVAEAAFLRELFPPEEAPELQYLMNRARRTGVAVRQIDFKQGQRPLHLSLTISALEGTADSGFVVVIEDTTELLRAQKTVAWREVARRIAHEMKNPLTPITLSAQRIERQVERAARAEGKLSAGTVRILQECAATVTQEVESVRTLVDEFSQFARFPASQPEAADLNEVVAAALGVFEGRLDGIQVTRSLAPDLPPVRIDREQFKRAVVNLIDNSAEAMAGALRRNLYVGTRAAGPDAVELVVADSGCGISIEEKEKLFLPYFSTKGRGTGLGLAIVNQILSDHNAQIRVEDNKPAGARFIVEIPAIVAAEEQAKPVGSPT